MTVKQIIRVSTKNAELTADEFASNRLSLTITQGIGFKQITLCEASVNDLISALQEWVDSKEEYE